MTQHTVDEENLKLKKNKRSVFLKFVHSCRMLHEAQDSGMNISRITLDQVYKYTINKTSYLYP